MTRAYNPRVIEELRDRIAHLEGGAAKKAIVLPFGVPELDERLPGGGLSYGSLHEIAGGGAGTVDGAAAALFAAGIAARSKGKVLWCLTRPDLFPGYRPGRPASGPRDLLRRRQGRGCAGFHGRGAFLRWIGGGGRGTCASADGGIPAAAAGCRKDGHHGPRCPQMAATDGSVGLRQSDSLYDTMEGECAPVGGAAGRGRWPPEMAGGIDARESRRVC